MNPARRAFLMGDCRRLAGLGRPGGHPVTTRLLLPRFSRTGAPAVTKLVEVDQMEPRVPVRFAFTGTASDARVEARVQRGVWIYTDDRKSFTVYNGHCTHLACGYAFEKGRRIFHCPCNHASSS